MLDREREIDLLRKHRESLLQMLADVDAQLKELGEITTPIAAGRAAQRPSQPDTPFSRPLATTPAYDEVPPAQPGSGPRVILILAAAVVALALIAYLIWRASSDRGAPAATETVVEESTAAADPAAAAPDTVAESDTIAPASTRALVVAPVAHDYGLVRKGTRVTRQYQVTNNSDEPLTIALPRSACRCLYYEYEGLIPPKASETVTVTVDGAKAKAGTLRETLRVTTKADPSIATTFDVIATIR